MTAYPKKIAPGTKPLICCLLAACMLVMQSACTGVTPRLADVRAPEYVTAEPGDSLLSRFAPLFILEDADRSYNRIGTPALRPDRHGQAHAYVDPQRATIYALQQPFARNGASYTNLIYRIHFVKTPYNHLTAGKNVGLLVLITLDSSEQPLLVTTVHTCGCYLGIIPTDLLPQTADPPGWSRTEQRVYGERLPGQIALPAGTGRYRFALPLRSGSHRVMGLELLAENQLPAPLRRAYLKPMEELRKLPFAGRTESFFETEGPRKGYVKNSRKPYERLLMSWWAFDWRIGEDKDLGPRAQTGTVFYTSLKFWARDDSDLWNFNRFLDYWGWKL